MNQPDVFVELDELLERRSKPELIHTVKEMLGRHSELELLVEAYAARR
jgi:hypothetical protein